MYQNSIKRLFDIVVSLFLLPLLIIFFVIVSLAIKLEDRGPIFYNATRMGVDQKHFKMFKFRSMKTDAPDLRNPDGTTYNSSTDSRVTKVGQIIRKLSIDELPQLLNVLKGDMSLIGPRPSPLGDKSIYPQLFFKKFDVRPGITGYSQALVRNNASMDKRIELDAYYVENVSLLLDIKILFWTVFSVLGNKNINRN